MGPLGLKTNSVLVTAGTNTLDGCIQNRVFTHSSAKRRRFISHTAMASLKVRVYVVVVSTYAYVLYTQWTAARHSASDSWKCIRSHLPSKRSYSEEKTFESKQVSERPAIYRQKRRRQPQGNPPSVRLPAAALFKALHKISVRVIRTAGDWDPVSPRLEPQQCRQKASSAAATPTPAIFSTSAQNVDGQQQPSSRLAPSVRT